MSPKTNNSNKAALANMQFGSMSTDIERYSGRDIGDPSSLAYGELGSIDNRNAASKDLDKIKAVFVVDKDRFDIRTLKVEPEVWIDFEEFDFGEDEEDDDNLEANSVTNRQPKLAEENTDGAIFACFENFWILLFAAVVGVISATGGDFGPFRAIEESTLSTLTTPITRADVLAWYVTTASVGSAVGSELSGRLVTSLLRRNGWTTLDAYHAVFWVYSGIGVLNILLTLLLSSSCEFSVQKAAETEEAGTLLDSLEGRTEEDDESPPTGPSLSKPEKKVGFAQVSKETLSVMYKLWFLLIVDSLADGMVGYSLTVYYLDQKFSLSKSTLGDVVSISYFLSSFSTIFAGPLARRLGLINTMVFTHLPSSAAVLLFPAPNSVILTVTLFFIRTGLNNMDQAPRSAFLAAVVKEEERTAVMGITSMLRTLAAAAGPTVTGVLAGQDRFWIAFVAAGTLRIAYDLGLFTMFVNMKLYQHEKTGVEGTYREVDEEERNSAADTEGRVRE
ncbi:MFS general substrate transporter [Aureobasidium pullulans]|nr:MFS general substrate transporter [Aureobasidium pullulans]